MRLAMRRLSAIEKLLKTGFCICLIIGVAYAATPAECSTSPPMLSCSEVSGRTANMSSIFLESEYIAGSLLMYSRSALTIAGVSGAQPVTGPGALASLNSSQIRANGVNASLHVTLPAGQKCRCSLSGSGVLNCSDLVMPKPPWPAHVGCQWYLAKGDMLMETNASSANYSCLDSATSSVTLPDLFWPKSMSPGYNAGAGDLLFQKSFIRISQEFNGSGYSALISDAYLDTQWPVRISVVRQEAVTLPNGELSRALVYRRYLGWSRHCLRECRVVYKPGSSVYTFGETCRDLESPVDTPKVAAPQLTEDCVWAFTVDCQPVLARSDNLSVPCQLSSSLTSKPTESTDFTTSLISSTPISTVSTEAPTPETSMSTAALHQTNATHNAITNANDYPFSFRVSLLGLTLVPSRLLVVVIVTPLSLFPIANQFDMI